MQIIDKSTKGWLRREIGTAGIRLVKRLIDKTYGGSTALIGARLAPSIITRNEIECFSLSIPRFAIRTYFKSEIGDEQHAAIINLRRLAKYRAYAKWAEPPDYFDCKTLGLSNSDNSEVVESKSLSNIIRQASPIADCLLSVPGGMKEDGFFVITQRLGNLYGEEYEAEVNSRVFSNSPEPLEAVPFMRHISLAGGLCAQAVSFMASTLCQHYATMICGMLDTTFIASPNGDGGRPYRINGLLNTEISKYMQSIGLSAEMLSPHPTSQSRARPDIPMSESIHANIASGFPVIALVDQGIMSGDIKALPLQDHLSIEDPARDESAESDFLLENCRGGNGQVIKQTGLVKTDSQETRHHAVLIVGTRKKGWNDYTFVMNDPGSLPFVRVPGLYLFEWRQIDDGDLNRPIIDEKPEEPNKDSGVNRQERSKPLGRKKNLVFLPVVPAAVKMPYSEISRQEYTKGMTKEEAREKGRSLVKHHMSLRIQIDISAQDGLRVRSTEGGDRHAAISNRNEHDCRLLHLPNDGTPENRTRPILDFENCTGDQQDRILQACADVTKQVFGESGRWVWAVLTQTKLSQASGASQTVLCVWLFNAELDGQQLPEDYVVAVVRETDGQVFYPTQRYGVEGSGDLALNPVGEDETNPGEAVAVMEDKPGHAFVRPKPMPLGVVSSFEPRGLAEALMSLNKDPDLSDPSISIEMYAFMHEECREYRTFKSKVDAARSLWSVVPDLLNTPIGYRGGRFYWREGMRGYRGLPIAWPKATDLLSDLSEDTDLLKRVSEDIGKTIRKCGVAKPISGIATYIPKIAHENEEGEFAVRSLKGAVMLMGALRDNCETCDVPYVETICGSRNLGVGFYGGSDQAAGRKPGAFIRSRERAIATLFQNLVQVHPTLEDQGVYLAAELEPGPIHAISSLQDVEKLVQLLDDAGNLHRIGLNLDVPHYYLAGISPADLDSRSSIINRLVNVHLSHHDHGHFADRPLPKNLVGTIYQEWLDRLRDWSDRSLGGGLRVSLEQECLAYPNELKKPEQIRRSLDSLRYFWRE